MVFLVGPRQAGKTWLAQTIQQQFTHTAYLNYDSVDDRRVIQELGWLLNTELLILDELHKMPGWQNYLKGLYDTKPEHLKIIVTGSARLDVLSQVGDSLAGRYFIHHLLPFSPAELKQIGISNISLDHLLERGGFPEPLLAENNMEAQRWRSQYISVLLRDELFELENIQNLKAIQLIFELLRSRVGSPVSYTSLAEDAAVSPNTVKKYIQILEALYLVFRITPYSKNIARSLLKEPKIYFYDTGLVKNSVGAQLENCAAVCLLKHTLAKQDYEGASCSLNYLRTKDNKEVDFALVNDDQVELLIEVKNKDSSLNKTLLGFHNKYQLPAVQAVKELRQSKQSKGISILKLEDFLAELLL